MFEVKDLIKTLKKERINFFTGVPDSVLKSLSTFLDKKNINQHMITSNEGNDCARSRVYNLKKKWLVFICKTLVWEML